jgi:catalase (peroxidase I)
MRVPQAAARPSSLDARLAAAEQTYASLIIPNIYGLLARLAFHDCGTYNPGLEAAVSGGRDTTTNTSTSLPPGRVGGCNGSVRYEFQQSNNLDLFLAWPWVDAGHKALAARFGDGVFSFADCIAIAASVAVAKATGPVMHVGYGRPDADGPDPRAGVTHDPAGDRLLTGKAGIEAMLASWAAYGHSADTLTTLVGAHTFGVSSQHAPIGLLTPQSIIFSKRYYERVRDGAGYFPSDDALRYSPATSALVDAYADDEGLFFEAFKREFSAMTWWGVAAPRQGVVG